MLKRVSEWLHRNDVVKCEYCRKQLKKKDACVHSPIKNAVEYFHHDCFAAVSKYLWNGVVEVIVYEEENK